MIPAVRWLGRVAVASLAAFLAYSRGLTAEDEGRFDEANRFYRDALRIDPGFGAALQRSSDAILITGARRSPRGDAARNAADDLNPSSADAATAPGRSGEHRPPQKDPASAATNTDRPGKSGNTKVSIKGPKPR